ncbi:hypothetical protein CH63R_11030 [Colletotrichum higginsianum IMI 349063]|uniref:Uncharacterized protein n=1 Tax=Colletotrichum higginsianum (strain IMI 349063) TaxID=759273 RepID=A0A1B7XX28_COLHI|nr:hypothetical protein CH63R_11030 [Colletotrichum higginsianum IMI 349063]OBR04327.1 hypothetical protein CH63R_11030 [Colletotrichum higginsianum IMI 349063]
MFATLRTEDRHGEVPRRRKVDRTSALDNVEAAKTTVAAQTIITTSAEGFRSEQLLPAAHTQSARGSQIGESLVQAPGFIDSSQSSGSQSCELLPGTSPDFQDLDLPDYMESNTNDFDMDELLDVHGALSEQDAEALEMGSAFATCTSPKDKATTRESSLATSNSSSEKVVGILEDVASVWESTTLACGSDGNAAQIEVYGHAHRWVPISLGQYHIDTVQERCEIFGFLILAQAKNLGSLLDRLRLHAEERRLESQQSSLQPIALRVQELQEALSGMDI